MYITVHRAGPPLFVELWIEHCIVLSPRISFCRVCNRHVIGSAVLRENHPIDVNRGRIPSTTHFHDLRLPDGRMGAETQDMIRHCTKAGLPEDIFWRLVTTKEHGKKIVIRPRVMQDRLTTMA